jgi:general secretion pathway protein I
MKARGFTLLEVLVAIAILGLGLTGILGAMTGAFSSASRAEHLSIATDLARCKLSELELDLVQRGFQLADASYDGRCCEGEETDTYLCEWRVERVKLPELSSTSSIADEPTQVDGSRSAAGELGPLGILADAQRTGGSSLGAQPSLDSLGEQVAESAGGIEGMTQMLFGFVYPTLKPMLEASIRRLTVVVKWREGRLERELPVVLFVADPQKGGFEGELEGEGSGQEGGAP